MNKGPNPNEEESFGEGRGPPPDVRHYEPCDVFPLKQNGVHQCNPTCPDPVSVQLPPAGMDEDEERLEVVEEDHSRTSAEEGTTHIKPKAPGPASPVSTVSSRKQEESSCCFRIGYGALMKPCCLTIVKCTPEFRSEVGRMIPGGAMGVAPTCPVDAEEGAKLIEMERIQRDEEEKEPGEKQGVRGGEEEGEKESGASLGEKWSV